MLNHFAPMVMTSTGFVQLLGKYLAEFQQSAHLLTTARLLDRPTDELAATLHRHLLAYNWALQSRALLRGPEAATPQQQATELHLRLSVVETLVHLHYRVLPEPEPGPLPDALAPAPEQLQRLAAAESRVFHLYGVAPLN